MVFSGLIFLYAFFPLSLLGYALCRSLKAKNICLLVFSLVFYAWGEPKYVLLLASMALFDWYFARKIDKASAEESGQRKFWLGLACATDLGLIGFFKYSGMICSLFGPPPAFVESITLPIGISFYTFQLLTYVIDVYRRKAPAQKEYWHVLLYAALFHQCIAGPIVRYGSIEKELFEARDNRDMVSGIQRFTVGLAKKVLLANTCGILADRYLLADSVIADADAFETSLHTLSQAPVLALWLGLLAFTLQIYLDFSAYSDMAIGMGRMLGFHYPENFRYPYISRSVTEFWRRWHMTLSGFFRDYVYIPLGGNRCGKGRTLFNLFVVWALTGLWHGASWNFVLWGLYYFVLLTIERLFWLRALDKMPGTLSALLSHLLLPLAVMLGWVLFKFTDMRLGLAVLRGLFGGAGHPLSGFQAVTDWKSHLFFLFFCLLACTPVFRRAATLWNRLEERGGAAASLSRMLSCGVLPVVLLLLSTAGLVGNSYNPFLYFQF